MSVSESRWKGRGVSYKNFLIDKWQIDETTDYKTYER